MSRKILEFNWQYIFERSEDALVICDKKGCILDANLFYLKSAGITKQEALGKFYWKMFPKISGGMQLYKDLVKKSEAIILPNGKYLLLSSTDINDTAGRYLYTLIACIDVTALGLAKKQIEKLNKLYLVLSLSNRELVHSKDEPELLQAVCKLLVKNGGYRAAWVVSCKKNEEDTKKIISIVASDGLEPKFIQDLELSWENEGNIGPTITCITMKKPIIERHLQKELPVSMRHFAIELGISESISIPLMLKHEIFGAITVTVINDDVMSEEEITLLTEIASDVSYGIGKLRNDILHINALNKLANSMDHAVAAIAATVEMRDPYTAGHQRRVAKLATAIATEMGLPFDQIEEIRIASLVHDIGKIHVPAEILSSPAKLTDAEFTIIKTHSQVGHDILFPIDFPWPVAEIVLQHHERMDGSGYPHGLKGEEILLSTRVLSVADTIDAMSSHRPYRPSLGIFLALKEISSQKGRLYDNDVVQATLNLFLVKGYEM